MKMHIGTTCKTHLATAVLASAFLAGFLTCAQTALGDTLELKSGQIVQGKFLGGSPKNIRFLVDGHEMIYPTQDVLNIGFSDSGDASAPDGASQAQPPPPSQPQDAQGGPQGPAAPAAAAPATAPPPPSDPPSGPPPAPSPQANANAQGANYSSPNPPPSSPYVTIPAGTTVFIRMIDGVDSSVNQIGDTFHASLENALVVGNTVVAPKGADAYGKLTQAKEAGKISGGAELTLELTGIRIGDKIVPLDSTDYNVAGKGRGTQSAQRIGGGAVIGTIIGAIAGGGKGAAIGGVVGAGAGTAVQVSTHGESVRVPSETLLEFRLQQDVSTPLAGSGN